MSLARQGVEASALGDAAIQLVLQDMVSRTVPISHLSQVETIYRGVSMVVQVMPLNGLIDINGAPVPLLASLYAVGGVACLWMPPLHWRKPPWTYANARIRGSASAL